MPSLLVLEVPSTSPAPCARSVPRVLIHVVPPFLSPFLSSSREGAGTGGGGFGGLASDDVQGAQSALLWAQTPGLGGLRSSYGSDQ